MFQQLKQRFFNYKTPDEARLTAKEIELIRKTWSHLRSDIAGFKLNGADLFIRFFTQYPDYQRQFKSFKDVPIRFSNVPMQEMRVNKKLLAHGTYVMYTIGMLVDNLENPETLEQMLKRLARNHYRRRINITAFELLRDTLVDHLADRVGSELFTKKAAVAWRKAFGYILSVLDREFNALEMDVRKKGSYYQLNLMHKSAKKTMLYEQRQRSSLSQYQQHHRSLPPQPPASSPGLSPMSPTITGHSAPSIDARISHRMSYNEAANHYQHSQPPVVPPPNPKHIPSDIGSNTNQEVNKAKPNNRLNFLKQLTSLTKKSNSKSTESIE